MPTLRPRAADRGAPAVRDQHRSRSEYSPLPRHHDNRRSYVESAQTSFEKQRRIDPWQEERKRIDGSIQNAGRIPLHERKSSFSKQRADHARTVSEQVGEVFLLRFGEWVRHLAADESRDSA